MLTALKTQLDAAKGKWVDELPGVLWAYKTTARKPTSISPFVLTYGMEAIIPTKIDMPMLQMDMLKQLSTESLIKDLDTADELHKITAIRIVSYHRWLENLYNKRVKPRVFQPRDLVLRKVFENTVDLVVGKFQANWEGPYIVTRVGKAGSYALDKLDGTPIPKMWNDMHLKRYYQ